MSELKSLHLFYSSIALQTDGDTRICKALVVLRSLGGLSLALSEVTDVAMALVSSIYLSSAFMTFVWQGMESSIFLWPSSCFSLGPVFYLCVTSIVDAASWEAHRPFLGPDLSHSSQWHSSLFPPGLEYFTHLFHGGLGFPKPTQWLPSSVPSQQGKQQDSDPWLRIARSGKSG